MSKRTNLAVMVGAFLCGAVMMAQSQTAAPREISWSEAQKLLAKPFALQYPDEAKANHIEGTVVYKVTVRSTGQYGAMVKVSGSSLLSQACVDSIKATSFRPLQVNGHAVAFTTRVPCAFGGTAESAGASAPAQGDPPNAALSESLDFIKQVVDDATWRLPSNIVSDYIQYDGTKSTQLSATGCIIHITETTKVTVGVPSTSHALDPSTLDQIRNQHGYDPTTEIWRVTLPLDRVDPAHVVVSGASVLIPTSGKYVHFEHVRQGGPQPPMDEITDRDTEYLPVSSEDLAKRLVAAFVDSAKACGAKTSKY